jgi:hypothetical protein
MLETKPQHELWERQTLLKHISSEHVVELFLKGKNTFIKIILWQMILNCWLSFSSK